jgi:hypothetical protein
MKIKVLKNTTASKDQTGTTVFEYQSGEVYDIYEELANVFISEKWGIAEEIETQDLEIKIETQDFPKKKKKDAN